MLSGVVFITFGFRSETYKTKNYLLEPESNKSNASSSNTSKPEPSKPRNPLPGALANLVNNLSALLDPNA